MDNPLVSVVVPVFNAEATIAACLQSVLQCRYDPFEVIVVDNASTDGTAKVISQFVARDARICLVSAPVRGRGSARQTGIESVRGEIVAMTDADCVVSTDWLDRITAPIRLGSAMAVVGSEVVESQNYWAQAFARAHQNFQRGVRRGDSILSVDTKNFACLHTLLSELGFDRSLQNFEDLELALRLRARTNIRFVPDVRVVHRYPESAIAAWRLCADRGFWTMNIFLRYRKTREARAEPHFASFRWHAVLLFPLWLLLESAARPARDLPFFWLSEIAWRCGAARALLTNQR